MKKYFGIITLFTIILILIEKGSCFNPTNFVANYLLKEHEKCQIKHDDCHQKALDLLTPRGFHSFYEESRKCIASYETCLSTFQRHCDPNCKKICPLSYIGKGNGNGNGNDCLETCRNMCQ